MNVDRFVVGVGILLSILSVSISATETKQDLHNTAMNPKLTTEQRVAAIRKLYPTLWANNSQLKRRICIWDLGGRSGPIFAAAQDQKTELMSLGIEVDMEAYTSESIMAEELKAGRCDAAFMTGMKARTFNKFSGTIDSVGALPTLKHMKVLLKAISSPRAAEKLETDRYIVLGIAPAGAAYIFVNDKKINSLTKAAGKRIAVLDYDLTQAKMVLKLGATPVPSSLVGAPNKFNNGAVDVLPAPLVAYQFMELYRGMEPDGGIIDYPFSQASLQMIGLKDKFPTEVAQLMREGFYNSFDRIVSQIKAQTGEIPEHWWIKIPAQEKQDYEVMMQQARIELREADYYDGGMLTIQRKVRCKLDATRFECPNPVE
ncbi:MAG: hypothetical protein JKY50_04785 [Oleispira sp.]|nr:hypothetical protein [Oleispira sp.]